MKGVVIVWQQVRVEEREKIGFGKSLMPLFQATEE